MITMSNIIILLAIGGAGGFLSGLLGVGGGIIFVPALYYSFTHFGITGDAAMHVSVGTSVALVLGTGASSAFWHHKKGSVDFTILRAWSPAVVLGVAIGTTFASSVGGNVLKMMFAGTALLISVYMAFSHEPAEEARGHKVSLAAQRAVAAFIAMISALIGVGGAMLNIPFMTYIGVPIRKSVGTGGALAFFISFPAMIGYIASGLQAKAALPPYSFGYVNLLAVAMILPVCMVLSPVGVHVSHNMPRRVLRRIFAGVLMCVSLRMFLG